MPYQWLVPIHMPPGMDRIQGWRIGGLTTASRVANFQEGVDQYLPTLLGVLVC